MCVFQLLQKGLQSNQNGKFQGPDWHSFNKFWLTLIEWLVSSWIGLTVPNITKELYSRNKNLLEVKSKKVQFFLAISWSLVLAFEFSKIAYLQPIQLQKSVHEFSLL